MITALEEKDILLNIAAIVDTISVAETLNTNDLDTLSGYLATCVTLQALATETHASTKYHLLAVKEVVLNDILKAEINGLQKDGMKTVIKISPSIQKLFSECRAKEWQYLEAKTERLCANISHTIDAVRTMISLAKQESYYSRMNQNN